MRPVWVLLLGCLLSGPIGCAGEESMLAPKNLLPHATSLLHASPAEVVQMDIALLERPLGDRYICQDLWSLADEQAMGLQLKGRLQENGWHVGKVGTTPAELQALLTSEQSCLNPRRLTFRVNDAKPIQLGPVQPRLKYVLQRDGQPLTVRLEKVQCSLLVSASYTPEGKTKLKFTPQLKHGESSHAFRSVSSGLSREWALEESRPTEVYSFLSWELTVSPTEWVVIGGRYAEPDSLGYQCFVTDEEEAPVQRLLVIRTGKPQQNPLLPSKQTSPTSEEPLLAPLASQASYSAGRAKVRVP